MGPSTEIGHRGLERLGEFLFRWRSFTPVPVLLAAIPLLLRSRGGGGAVWTALGIASCAAGQALRAWVLGEVPDGTSGQNQRLIATGLNTTGPYARTRNPLYLGNFLITLGLCLAAHDVALLLLVGVLFAVQYRAIVAAEERFLHERFGSQFDEYRLRVPRFWPRLGVRDAADSAQPWSWRRALRKEHNPFAAWATVFVALLASDQIVRARAAGAPPSLRGYGLIPHVVAFAAVAVAWLCVKGWKHRWAQGGFTDDLRRRLRETAR
ncbi:MAG TPA: isoprenylcysteine carboxylmethyltransferase family protein [Myxococcales bacterium]|nr:isoprenylcysteine carboxylmethyltransferase family protein [Myxococcales bacterium]